MESRPVRRQVSGCDDRGFLAKEHATLWTLEIIAQYGNPSSIRLGELLEPGSNSLQCRTGNGVVIEHEDSGGKVP
jgi:hypothetical protein